MSIFSENNNEIANNLSTFCDILKIENQLINNDHGSTIAIVPSITTQNNNNNNINNILKYHIQLLNDNISK